MLQAPACVFTVCARSFNAFCACPDCITSGIALLDCTFNDTHFLETKSLYARHTTCISNKNRPTNTEMIMEYVGFRSMRVDSVGAL